MPSGETVHRDSFGGCDLNYGTAAGDPHKIADSNAFRKACDKFGLAREVGGEEFNSNAKPVSGFTKPQTFSNSNTASTQSQTTSSNPFIKR